MPDAVTFEVRVSDSFSPWIRRARKVVEAPFGAGRSKPAIAAMRSSVAEDFAMGGGKRPEGGRYAWPSTKPFGTRQPRPLPLGGPFGFLAQAWAGKRFGNSSTSNRRVAIGVNHPAAAMHRGGAGLEAGSGFTTIKAKKKAANGLPAMYYHLGLTYGVWISPRKLLNEGLRIPARPHATDNPELREELVALLQRSMVGA